MSPRILDSGYLDVGHGHLVHWEMAGTPDAPAALVLHGGPGSGCRTAHYDLFDLDHYKVVLMDQRGCGRSRPLASETLDALTHNTTDDLLCDIVTLKQHLGVSDWLVFGGSWGSTLALLYAQLAPDHVRQLVLAGVATTARRDLAWLYEDVGNLFPESFEAFHAMVPDAADVWDRIAGYGDLLAHAEYAQNAADAWCAWELAIFQQTFEGAGGGWAEAGYRLGFARIVTHYFRNFAWRSDGYIHDHMERIAHIPGVMIHSRFDSSCPLRAPWELAKHWPAARLEVLGGNDHSALSEVMKLHIRTATDGFRMAGP
ncbi:MAG: alpha/beta fold hydrolase [Sulfitobacter sp.]